jgi:hypothetical protein
MQTSSEKKIPLELTEAEAEAILKARARQRQQTPFRDLSPEQQAATLRKMGVPTL